MKPSREIALAVIVREGRLLVGRRPNGPLAGLWEFPGGKVEAGESVEAAAVRESAEELGLSVEAVRVLGTVEHEYPEVRVRLHAVLCRIEGAGDPRPLAVETPVWVTPAELAARPIPEPNHAILDLLKTLDPPL